VPQIVAWRIGAILSKFLAEAEIRRSVQPCYEPFDNRSRDKIQARDLGQHSRIEEAVCDFCRHFASPAGSRLPFEQAAQDFVRIQPI
jgi:hypothetical protein